mgnify:CR=1 FL=1
MSTELVFALACGFLALAYGMVSVKWILAKPTGSARMQEIANAIQEGAKAYLNRQYTTIGLVGVAINGSIVVLAAIRGNPRARRGEAAAIIDETVAATHHILSTTLTTIAGFMPLLVFSGGDFWPPLAVVIAGGVGLIGLLSLVFTPAAYALIQRAVGDRQAHLATQAISA